MILWLSEDGRPQEVCQLHVSVLDVVGNRKRTAIRTHSGTEPVSALPARPHLQAVGLLHALNLHLPGQEAHG